MALNALNIIGIILPQLCYLQNTYIISENEETAVEATMSILYWPRKMGLYHHSVVYIFSSIAIIEPIPGFLKKKNM